MIQLDLQPELEAQLAAEAQVYGLALDEYVEEIVAGRPLMAGTGDWPEEMRLKASLRQGLSEIEEGDTRPAREVFADLRQEYDLRG